MIGIEALYSSWSVIKIPVKSTAMDEFWLQKIKVEMLNEIRIDHSHLQNKRFPITKDKRIGILIGADSFTATLPRLFTLELDWTLTGPFHQGYTQKSIGQSSHRSIALFNIKRRQDDPDDDLLLFFWTIERLNVIQCSFKDSFQMTKKLCPFLMIS